MSPLIAPAQISPIPAERSSPCQSFVIRRSTKVALQPHYRPLFYALRDVPVLALRLLRLLLFASESQGSLKMLRAERLSPSVNIHRGILSAYALPVKKPCHSVRAYDRGPASAKPRTKAATAPVITPDPFYLFHCAHQWHKLGEATAGWELVQAMRSRNRGIRALGAELIAGTENGRLLV